MTSLLAILRHLQGERPGMRAGLRPSPIVQDLATILYPDMIFAPSIAIQTAVKIADVSFWQEDIDFVRMKEAAIAGAIIRAGQRSWVDKAGSGRSAAELLSEIDEPAHLERVFSS